MHVNGGRCPSAALLSVALPPDKNHWRMKKAAGRSTSGSWETDLSAGHPGQEPGQLLAADRVLKFPHRLGFDLADAFSGDLEDAPHLFQRVGVAVGKSISQADDL